MPAAKKIEQVEELTRFLDGADLVIGTTYAGMSVPQFEGLRRALRHDQTTYRVVKNRLVLRAAADLGRPEIGEVLDGPVALVVSRGDPMPVIQALSTYLRTNRVPLRVTNVVMNGRVLSAEDMEKLASLPSREVLIAQILGAMNGVSQKLVGVLHAHLSSIVRVLEQRRRQLEERS